MESQKSITSSTHAGSNDDIDKKIINYAQRLEPIGVCMVYFITTYYEYEMEFGSSYKDKRYEYDKFYYDKTYQNDFIDKAAQFYLSETVDTLIETAKANNKAANINNWVRSAACEKAFKERISEKISSDLNLENKYRNFMNMY